MPVGELVQREWKRRLVEEALGRIGGFEGFTVDPLRHGGLDLGYRNRIELTLAVHQDGRPHLGYHAADPTRGVIDVPRCLLQSEAGNRVLASVRNFLLEPDTKWSSETWRIGLRTSSLGRVSIALWDAQAPFPAAAELAQWLCARHPEIESIVQLHARPGRRGGLTSRTLAGSATIEEQIGGLTFHLPPSVFTQVNVEWMSRLPEVVCELAGGVVGSTAVDLYGGIGINGIALARAGASRVVVCEADAAAVSCGRDAAERGGLASQVTFLHGDVLGSVERDWPSETDLVVANPPRTGMAAEVTRALSQRSIRRMVLVSCDPPTLARDVRALAAGRMRLVRAVPLDLFPQTPHIETVALLEREKRD